MNFILNIAFFILSIGGTLLFALIFLRLLGQTLNKQYIYFGMGIFFLGIGIHGILALPVAVYQNGISVLYKIPVDQDLPFKMWELLYFAIAAGIGQEFSKAIPIWAELRRSSNSKPVPPYIWYGFNIGIGFSLSEIIIIGILDWQMELSGQAVSNLLLGSAERISASVFHATTGMLIAFGIENKKVRFIIPFAMIIHALLDFSAGIFNKYSILSTEMEEVYFFIVVMTLFIAVIIYIRMYRY